MSKYHKLVRQYRDEINKIKALKARYETLADKAEKIADEIDFNAPGEPGREFFVAVERADAAMEIAHNAHGDYVYALSMLSEDIEAEYAEVPFSKPRQAGIAGFWREAGIK